MPHPKIRAAADRTAKMLHWVFTLLVLVFGCTCAAPASDDVQSDKAAIAPKQGSAQDKSDLKAEASSYRSDWGRSYPSGYHGYSVSGYGTLDDRYNYNGGGYGNYDGYAGNGYSKGYSRYGANGYDGYRGSGNGGYGNVGGYGNDYGDSGYGGYGSYGSNGYSSYGGNGGYGGYGGNGGLRTYYGYNDPTYQGAYHLGYGYYNKKPGYGSIYSNGITPSLITGYRGYSRR